MRFKIFRHGPMEGVCKSHGIWVQEGSKIAPLIYLRKPKRMTDEDFETILNSLSVTITHWPGLALARYLDEEAD